ncbi:hypothetical protein SDC9_192165 [bioreactor metagenome]|uniref:Uncharacterized protein n=1 Tax=bioreactor metagenome TaxID=1076179 RepID=A0A645I0A6_9ZZZZ
MGGWTATGSRPSTISPPGRSGWRKSTGRWKFSPPPCPPPQRAMKNPPFRHGSPKRKTDVSFSRSACPAFPPSETGQHRNWNGTGSGSPPWPRNGKAVSPGSGARKTVSNAGAGSSTPFSGRSGRRRPPCRFFWTRKNCWHPVPAG